MEYPSVVVQRSIGLLKLLKLAGLPLDAPITDIPPSLLAGSAQEELSKKTGYPYTSISSLRSYLRHNGIEVPLEKRGRKSRPITPAEWERLGLGKIPDVKLAETLKFSRERIRQIRKRLGIPPFPKGYGYRLRTEKKIEAQLDEIRKMLETCSVTKTAKAFGHTPSTGSALPSKEKGILPNTGPRRSTGQNPTSRSPERRERSTSRSRTSGAFYDERDSRSR